MSGDVATSVHPLSLRLDRHPLDLFTCLWLKNSKTKPSGLCIPDTVLLDRGILLHWYFTSKSGEVLRRKKENTTKTKLLRFLQESNQGPIAAIYVHLAVESDRRALVVEHLTLSGVEELLNNPMNATHGMLQKFIQPKSCYNNMIQTTFAHDGCGFQAVRCSSTHMFVNSLIPLALRAATFERTGSSMQKTITNATMVNTLLTLNRDVIHHVVSTVGMNIARQVLHFKLGVDGRLYFLWPSLIIFENQETVRPCQLIAPTFLDSTTEQSPQTGTVAIECPACSHHEVQIKASQGVSFLVTFKAILAAHNMTKGEDNQISTVPPAIRIAYGPLTDDKFTSLSQDPSFLYRTAQVCEACCRDINAKANLYDQEQANASQRIKQPAKTLGRGIRWRSWKEPRQLLALPSKPQSARHLIRKPDPQEVAPATAPRRTSLAGPSLHLVAPENNNQQASLPEKINFVSKPRPVSAACTTMPFRPSRTPSTTTKRDVSTTVALATIRAAVKAATNSPNPSIRCLLVRHGLEPQHATMTVHELFSLCYKAKATLNFNDLQAVAVACNPRDNSNLIDIDALDVMLLQSPLGNDRGTIIRPKSCSGVSKLMSPRPPTAPPTPKPPPYQSLRVKSASPASTRTIVSSESTTKSPSLDLTDEEAACLYQILQGR
ncbi:hypothetical protein AC1031_007227 [Aphanomyces cochlioides]|nr:hypothetical protein AC1031_007227 [Aphanomyces cochlioides]